MEQGCYSTKKPSINYIPKNGVFLRLTLIKTYDKADGISYNKHLEWKIWPYLVQVDSIFCLSGNVGIKNNDQLGVYFR
jgi:hypothetical protein